MAFSLGAESGFSWIGEYDITADELLSGTGGNTETKTEQAERLILDLLADGKEMASEDIVKAAAEAGISERTVQNAKRSMGGILGARSVGSQWYNFIKKKQPPDTAKCKCRTQSLCTLHFRTFTLSTRPMLTAWGFSLEKILFCVNKLRKALDKTLHGEPPRTLNRSWLRNLPTTSS